MDGIKMVAELMAIAAKTAPKTRGKDYVEIKIITEAEDLKKLADIMVEYGTEKGKPHAVRDGENIRVSDAIILISLNKAEVAGLNCGACGVTKCSELKLNEGPEFDGPICAWRLVDLGIAVGSAVKTAGILNTDNRIMYNAGVGARKLGLIEGEIVLGIPLSATGKSIYFDRAK